MVHGRPDSSQFSKSGRNYYRREVLPAYRRNAWETATHLPGIDQQKGPNYAARQRSTIYRTKNAAEIKRLGLRDFASSPYSPDLSPTDFHFFKHLDNFLHERCFRNRADAETAFEEFIASRNKDFYSTGINKLVLRWQKCIESVGFYFD